MLIYVSKLTNRIGYTLNVVFRNILHIDFKITSDASYFEQFKGVKLCYSSQPIGDCFWIKPSEILFQTNIDFQELHPFEYEGLCALFPVYGRNLDLPFDVFGAAFYLLSRYEEYLPHRNDDHGRFLVQESIAFQKGFLSIPIVDHWALLLANKIKLKYPVFQLPERSFDMVETIDIDAAYCYRNKGFFRFFTGIFRDLFIRKDYAEVKRRIRVIFNKEHDPFDTFDYILELKDQHPSIPIVFFALLADYGIYDKNITYLNEEFRQLLKHLGDNAKLGIHSSYASLSKPELIGIERDRLAEIVHRNIVRNRSHFLRIELPKSYRKMVNIGIGHDFTMGYAELPGFRAGTCHNYPFYDLEQNSELPLTIHPFCMMDATLKRYMNLSPEKSLQTIKSLMDEVAKVGGTFCCIWHNENLCESFGWQGWRNIYEAMLNYADQLKRQNNEYSI